MTNGKLSKGANTLIAFTGEDGYENKTTADWIGRQASWGVFNGPSVTNISSLTRVFHAMLVLFLKKHLKFPLWFPIVISS